MPGYELLYYNSHGSAEPIRILFSLAGEQNLSESYNVDRIFQIKLSRSVGTALIKMARVFHSSVQLVQLNLIGNFDRESI